jgi:serine/threonine protein kinase
MVEKIHTHSDDDDVTRVKSDFTSESSLILELPTSPLLAEIIHQDTSGTMYTNYGDSLSGEIQLALGSLVKNTYELVAVLGEGGMGTVYKALNKVWEEVEARDPYVAIKVLKPELSANKQLVRSLYSDFDRTKMLANCPNIIKVQGFDRDGSHVYMTMEYLTGQTLGDYLNHEPQNLIQAWFIIEGIGNALAYAHKNNIVHRDIKPGNIMLTDDGIVKVLDFGIASKINENEGDETKFGGHELGALTVAYASPEMQRDYPPDARDDIYAFACVIYEVLTGKQFYKQKIHKAAPINGLNSRQMDALNKALAFERDQRTPSISELLEKLKPVKTPWVKLIASGVGVIIVSGLVFWVFNKTASPPQLTQNPVSQVVQTPVDTTPTAPLTPASTPVVVTPPVVPQQSETVITEKMPAAETITPPVPVSDTEPRYFATSSDGLIHIETSKSDYQNGESFQLTFTLMQSMYVRVIDHDAKGEETILRPNPRQPDKLLPAGKDQLFPPKGFNVPVKGPSGKCTVTIIASTQPFSKELKLLNNEGRVSEAVQNGSYSWAQVRYTLSQ